MEQSRARDYVGYGKHPPDPQWPNAARVAINFNLNYECGGEANVLDGDAASEGMLNDIGFPPVPDKRNPLAESAFEYGSRVGVWRVLRIFAKFAVPLSILGVATALDRVIGERPVGRPARAVGLIKFLDYAHGFDRVWFCRGIDIARHWRQVHPYRATG